jgi:hypothetical protein
MAVTISSRRGRSALNHGLKVDPAPSICSYCDFGVRCAVRAFRAAPAALQFVPAYCAFPHFDADLLSAVRGGAQSPGLPVFNSERCDAHTSSAEEY